MSPMLSPLARPTPSIHDPRHARHRQRTPQVLAVVLVVGLAAASGLVTISAEAQGVTGSLAGTVTDSGGLAIAGVDVVLKRQVTGSTWLYHETTTGTDGGYTLAGLEAGSWNLSARRDGYRSATMSIAIGLGEAKTQDLSLQALDVFHYRGTVRDSETANPIAGAIVAVSTWTETGQAKREVTTDTSGAFSIELYRSDNSITIMRGGYATYHDYVWGPSGDITRDIRLHSVPPQDALIQGRVVDADGNGVQAYVSMWTDWSSGGGWDDEPRIMVDAAEPAMEPGYATPDMWWPGGNHNSTVTATDGTFTMHAYAGAVVIEANRAGYLVARTTMALESGTTEVVLELVRLPARTVTITGIVTNARTGEAVPGASVSVQVPAAGDYAWASTDRQGRFEVLVRPGYTLLEVHHWGYDVYFAEPSHDAYEVSEVAPGMPGEAAPSSEPPVRGKPAPDPATGDGTRYHPASRVLFTQAGSEHELDIPLVARPEPTTTLVGYVVDTATDRAVPHARVSLQNHDTGDWGDATADEHGSFRFETHAGYHTLRVWSDGYLPYAVNVQAQASGTQRVDLFVTAGTWANEGWWSPDGEGRDGVHPMPRPSDGMAEDAASAPAESGAMDSGAEERSGFLGEGARSIVGGPGGLGAYTPAADSGPIPGPGIFAVLVALGALAVAVARRRE